MPAPVHGLAFGLLHVAAFPAAGVLLGMIARLAFRPLTRPTFAMSTIIGTAMVVLVGVPIDLIGGSQLAVFVLSLGGTIYLLSRQVRRLGV